MENLIIYNLLVGSLLITLGVVFIFCQEHLRRIDDSINSVILGNLWIGSYSYEAVLLMKAVYTFVGVSLVLLGAGIILNFIR